MVVVKYVQIVIISILHGNVQMYQIYVNLTMLTVVIVHHAIRDMYLIKVDVYDNHNFLYVISIKIHTIKDVLNVDMGINWIQLVDNVIIIIVDVLREIILMGNVWNVWIVMYLIRIMDFV
jgi:hypothetical protein